MATSLVVCRYCGKAYAPLMGRELPTACPYCDVADSAFTLWWMEAPKGERPQMLTPLYQNDIIYILRPFGISPEGL